jgi:predicted dinucleotide-binding enzyme
MTTIGFIGSGSMATVLASRALAAGHNVVLSNTRGPASLQRQIAALGSAAKAGSVAEVNASSDVLVLAIPFGAFDRVDPAIASDRVLIDVTNYYQGMYAPRALLDSGELTSGELIQQHFASARVVKAFNTIAAHHVLALARDSGAADRTAIPIAADEEETLSEASAALDELGFDALRVGRLEDSWRFGPGTPAWVAVPGRSERALDGGSWTASIDRTRPGRRRGRKALARRNNAPLAVVLDQHCVSGHRDRGHLQPTIRTAVEADLLRRRYRHGPPAVSAPFPRAGGSEPTGHLRAPLPCNPGAFERSGYGRVGTRKLSDGRSATGTRQSAESGAVSTRVGRADYEESDVFGTRVRELVPDTRGNFHA